MNVISITSIYIERFTKFYSHFKSLFLMKLGAIISYKLRLSSHIQLEEHDYWLRNTIATTTESLYYFNFNLAPLGIMRSVITSFYNRL